MKISDDANIIFLYFFGKNWYLGVWTEGVFVVYNNYCENVCRFIDE